MSPEGDKWTNTAKQEKRHPDMTERKSSMGEGGSGMEEALEWLG